MGTRGLYGLRKNDFDKTTYNHFDSYPDCLGRKIIEFINKYGNKLEEMYDNIILVNEEQKATKEQVEECFQYLDLSVSEKREDEWYCLLRNTQGDLEPYLNGLKYMIDNHDFILDSLFCEYAYIINLDTNKLEFWVGFQSKSDPNNRYGTNKLEENSKYYPCKLMKEIDLTEIMAMDEVAIDDLVEELNEISRED